MSRPETDAILMLAIMATGIVLVAALLMLAMAV